jgi:hypothetical protein
VTYSLDDTSRQAEHAGRSALMPITADRGTHMEREVVGKQDGKRDGSNSNR